jgi:hypothetical protein
MPNSSINSRVERIPCIGRLGPSLVGGLVDPAAFKPDMPVAGLAVGLGRGGDDVDQQISVGLLSVALPVGLHEEASQSSAFPVRKARGVCSNRGLYRGFRHVIKNLYAKRPIAGQIKKMVHPPIGTIQPYL